MQGSDGNFYGTTEYGGSNTFCAGCGTVFRISTNGTYSSLYSFGYPSTDAEYPTAGLVQGSDGNFYGTAEYGGTNGLGTVFRITTNGNETILYSFAGFGVYPYDGANPVAGLVQGSDGNFYGTTEYGGTGVSGTVFRISPSGNYTNLYSFVGPPTDGFFPQAGLVQGSDGNFYGTTCVGGQSTNCSHGCGTVFKLTVTETNSWTDGTGKWETGTNWSLGVAPSTSDLADLITNAGNKTVTIDAPTVLSNAINGCLTIGNLYIAGTANSTNTLFLNNAGTNTPLRVVCTGPTTLETNAALVVNNSVIVATNSFLEVGYYGGNASLSVTNGGALYDNNGILGSNSTSSGNSVLVAGAGSVWSNSTDLFIGYSGAGNQLIITNGGLVFSTLSYLGANPSASNNHVLVTGSGSVWTIPTNQIYNLWVGYNGAANQLTVANGGVVASGYASVGDQPGSSNNILVVTGPGSVWSNEAVGVGEDGSGNQLTIANGGQVISAYNDCVGCNGGSNNAALVTGSGSVWSNQTLRVGTSGAGNKLTVANGGQVLNGSGFYVGSSGAGSCLVISNGGAVYAGPAQCWATKPAAATTPP